MKINHCSLARRRFLVGMLGGGATAMSASVGPPLVAYLGNLREEPLPDLWEIEEADCPPAPGTSSKVKYGPIIALLIKTPEPRSELKVFDATCTHLTCKVNYRPKENRIFCPCHKGYFDIDGNPIAGPPKLPLREFSYRFHHGRLFIALDETKLEKENLAKTLQDH